MDGRQTGNVDGPPTPASLSQPRLTLRGAAAGPWAALALARNVEIVACHWPKGLDALEWGRIRGGRPARPAGGPIVGWDSTYLFLLGVGEAFLLELPKGRI